jgi:hypothetical protein
MYPTAEADRATAQGLNRWGARLRNWWGVRVVEELRNGPNPRCTGLRTTRPNSSFSEPAPGFRASGPGSAAPFLTMVAPDPGFSAAFLGFLAPDPGLEPPDPGSLAPDPGFLAPDPGSAAPDRVP